MMKTRNEALQYGLSFPDTYQDAPFHDPNWQLVRYKWNRKAFLWTYAFGGSGVQAKFLEAEGIAVIDGKVDLDVFQWKT